MSADRIEALQREYLELSDTVRRLSWGDGNRARLDKLQARETEIIRELRSLGARPRVSARAS